MVNAEEYVIGKDKILKINAGSAAEVQDGIEEIFKIYGKLLPESKKALILVKPNLNNDMNALTGGTTDLRIIAGVIKSLKKRGYSNIVIGDGPNTGAFHSKVDVISRLRIGELARRYNVQAMDFNSAQSVRVDLISGKAGVSKVCMDCDFFINLPKIKTHTEVTLSMSLKNLVGCFTGFNKREVHENLADNIVKMNTILKPDLHIVDGLVVMEGDGPSRGTPKKMNVIVAGENPFLIDAFCANMVGFDYRKVPYLESAAKKNFIERDLQLNTLCRADSIKKPKMGLLAKIFLRNWLIKLRFTRFLDPIFSTDFVIKSLVFLNIRQDLFNHEDAKIKKLRLDREKCIALARPRDLRLPNGKECNTCLDYCPFGLPIISPQFEFEKSDCIKCLYCYMVCPENAIAIDGELGFLENHLKRYSASIKKL